MSILKTPDELRAFLKRIRTIAIVGVSADPSRDSHAVAAYLQARGYRIIAVNPRHREVLGEPCYPSLADISQADAGSVDVVNVFRRSEEAAAVAREAIRLRFPAIWFQLGVATEEAIDEADRAGLQVVSDSCIKVAHAMLVR